MYRKLTLENADPPEVAGESFDDPRKPRTTPLPLQK